MSPEAKKRRRERGREHQRKWRLSASPEELEQERNRSLAWYHRNRNRILAEKRAKNARNPKPRKPGMGPAEAVQRRRERARGYYKKNRDKIIARNRTYAAKRLVREPDKVRAQHSRYVLKRLAAKKAAIHPDHSDKIEQELFEEAQRRGRQTGVLQEIDHIIPLITGGPHHHLNLQVLPRDLNRQKGADPFWEHPDFKCWKHVPQYLWPEKMVPSYLALLSKMGLTATCPPDIDDLK